MGAGGARNQGQACAARGEVPSGRGRQPAASDSQDSVIPRIWLVSQCPSGANPTEIVEIGKIGSPVRSLTRGPQGCPSNRENPSRWPPTQKTSCSPSKLNVQNMQVPHPA